MPYCPSCRAEYTAAVERCADCEQALVPELPPDVGARLQLIELYECYDGAEAERLVALCEAEGIAALARATGSSSFPTTIGTTAATRLLVEYDRAAEARALIEGARTDEVISAGGRFLRV